MTPPEPASDKNPFHHWQYPPMAASRLARFTDIDLIASRYTPPLVLETERETEARRLNHLLMSGAAHANGVDGRMPLVGTAMPGENLKHYLIHDDRLHAYAEHALKKMKDEKIYYRLGNILTCPVRTTGRIPSLGIEKDEPITPLELVTCISHVAKRDDLVLLTEFGQFMGHRMTRRLDDIDARERHVRAMQGNFPAKRHAPQPAARKLTS